jgi:DNA-binding NarL/FixJ family response regulator
MTARVTISELDVSKLLGGLSEGTVRKHLENIFARLDVSSRTAAVIRAFPDRAAG